MSIVSNRGMEQSQKDSQVKDKNQIQVINKAAAILKVLGDHAEGIRPAELTTQLGLPRATVHRILVSLEQNELVSWDRSACKVRLGLAVAFLGRNMQHDIRQQVSHFMEKLLFEIYEVVELAIFHNGRALLLGRLDAPHQLQIAGTPVGTEFSVFNSVSGKAMLAHLSDQEIRRFFAETASAAGMSSSFKIEEFIASLCEVRKNGIAIDLEELADGICAASIAFYDAYGTLISISLSVPAIRFYSKENQIVLVLKKIKGEIEQKFQGQKSHVFS